MMDFLGNFSFIPPKIDLLLLCILIILGVYVFTTKRKYKLPPGPTGLPFLGYLPLVGRDPPTQFQNLSKKYGDVFSLYFGRQLVIVVTDVVKAKELLNQPFVNDRPEDMFLLLPGGAGILEISGTQWTEQRRYTVAELKNLTLVQSVWEKLLEIEVRDFQDLLEKSEGKPIHIDYDLGSSISNNILSLISGHRLPVGDPRRDILMKGVDAFERIYDQSGFISFYPRIYKFLSKLGLIDVGQKLEDMENMNKFIRREIEEVEQDKDGDTYIHKYIAEIDKNRQLGLKNYFNEAGLIGNVQSLVMAASDTTKNSLQWLLLAMAAFPDIQENIHEELDSEIGKDGSASWMDRNKLPYTHATILEGQRWRTVVPLNVTHRVTEDMHFSGYDIPKGANIMTVITAFHTDTRFWKDPEKFQPERFLKDGKTVVTEPEGYLPFSHGKRKCPGKTVGLIEIFYYFVAILQKFQVLPESYSGPPNLEGFPGLTLHTKRQRLRFVLR